SRVREVNGPPRQGVRRHGRGGRAGPARPAQRSGQLQGAVPAGRRHRAVRRGADEPAAGQAAGRLHQYRCLVGQGHQRGPEVLRGQRCRWRQRRPRSTSGAWSAKAISEARKYCEVNVAASGEASNFLSIPPQSEWKLDPDAAYVHYTPNETISGVEFGWVPDVGDVPLVADMSSTILSRPIDVTRFGLIYAGAQKNIGPAGLAIVIVREDLLGQPQPSTPTGRKDV